MKCVKKLHDKRKWNAQISGLKKYQML